MKRQFLVRSAAVVLCSVLVGALAPALVCSQEECEDQIFAWAVGDTILVKHAGAFYNCCAVVVVAMETPEPFAVDFLETETLPMGPCDCMCCFDLDMWGFGFEPGHYTVRVWNDTRTVLYGEAEVDVHGDLLTSAGFGGYVQSGCLNNSGVGGDKKDTTWGLIKSMYE
ncbi:MAG: hypothetical protein KJ970_20390 [Candidatus Eisenbacteria bacterium]|uniref:Uncharacterized protein n=1 Tax=Eiseniibacteriota bacterium TaxID=2212470 RepID=A0A948S156_UNCEI|nr:hypothetical protein [Candidatus Eisenbacteria bacterium]MBU1948589.1 hypothetical protein [Candidatus Eisenbacteria bacterium]MBU2693284.1 hypothetical protein [Candidatus Eisenbacteria bacterium]